MQQMKNVSYTIVIAHSLYVYYHMENKNMSLQGHYKLNIQGKKKKKKDQVSFMLVGKNRLEISD